MSDDPPLRVEPGLKEPPWPPTSLSIPSGAPTVLGLRATLQSLTSEGGFPIVLLVRDRTGQEALYALQGAVVMSGRELDERYVVLKAMEAHPLAVKPATAKRKARRRRRKERMQGKQSSFFPQAHRLGSQED